MENRIQLECFGTVPPNRDNDCDWVDKNRSDLIHRYGNLILLVFKETVIGVGSTLDSALQDAERHLPSDGEKVCPVIAFLSPVSLSMNENIFWELIEKTHIDSNGYMEQQVPLLEKLLAERSIEDIVEFDLIFTHLFWKAYIARLWDAAYVIGCGCSDDGFYDFRAWLIGQGRQAYENALIDPESLAEILEPRHRDEVMDGGLTYTTWHAYEHKTGQEMPIGLLVPYNAQRAQLVGKLADRDSLESSFPRISAILGSCSDWFDKYPW